MARRRPSSPATPPLTQGAETALGQLAAYYRLGQFGGLSAGQTAQPDRPRLTTPGEIVSALQALGLAPAEAAGTRFSERYITIVTNSATGQVLARIPFEVEYSEGTARSTRSSRARRFALREMPRYLAGEDVDPSLIKVTTRLIRASRIAIS